MTSDWKNPERVADVSVSKDGLFASHKPAVTNHYPCLTVDLGLIGYTYAYELQQRLVAAIKAGSVTSRQLPVASHFLLLCEHPHVITLGRNGKREHLLASDRVLRQKGVEFHVSNRGGDITYHGPGQIVGYPILNLATIRRDVGWYVGMLEETMIRATADFGITAHREPGKTGIWVGCGAGGNARRAEKLGAIGVHLSRWVTSHGFAYNVSTDLRYFDLIVPCGISNRKATSLEKILARRVDRNEAAARITKHFGEIFDLDLVVTSKAALFERLQRFEQHPVAIPA